MRGVSSCGSWNDRPTIMDTTMSTRMLILLAALCAAPATVAGTDVWTPIGPFGGGIVRLAEDPADPGQTGAGRKDPQSRDLEPDLEAEP